MEAVVMEVVTLEALAVVALEALMVVGLEALAVEEIGARICSLKC